MQILLNGLIVGSLYGLIGLSFSIIYSAAGFFHLAHATVCSFGAYGVLFALKVLHWDMVPAIAAGLLLAMCLGGLMDLAVYRPLRRRGAGPLVLLLAGLGLLVILQNLISMIFGDGAKTIRTATVREGIALFGARITIVQAITIATAFVLFLATAATLKYTRAGMAIRALANSVELARAVGVDTDRVILLVFVAGSGLAGAAGILMGYDTDLTPLMGFRVLLMAVAAVIVGGVGSPTGAIIGGFSIGFISQLAALWLPVHWQEVIVFAVLILFLLIRPHGIFGKPLRTVTA